MSKGEKVKRYDAVVMASPLLHDLYELYGTNNVVVAGSVRRSSELVGDVDVVIVGGAEKLADLNGKYSFTGGKKRVDSNVQGIMVNLVFTVPESRGACLMYFTGSKQNNIRMRSLAKAKGFKLNEKGLWKDDELIAGDSELAVYGALGVEFVNPGDRE